MIYLLLAILCSSSIALIFKYSESRGLNRYALTTTNYVTAMLVSAGMVLVSFLKGGYKLSPSAPKLMTEFTEVVIKNSGTFSPEASAAWAVIMGVLTGILYFSNFLCYQESVKRNGAGLSGTFGRLGILVPMIFSVVIWKEFPGILQTIGILLSIASILMVNLSFKKDEVGSFSILLILLLALGGLGDFQNKLFQKYALLHYKDLFLLVIFFSAFLISVCFTIKAKEKVTGRDIVTGLSVGIPNLFSSYFLILALNSIPTTIAFPVYSAGSILFINIGGMLILSLIHI